MTFSLRNIVRAAAFATVVLVGDQSDAAAQDPLAGTNFVAPYCPTPATALSFRDRPAPQFFYPQGCGKVFGDNTDWALLPGGWSNRADDFYNGGTWWACLYDLPGMGGARMTVIPGLGNSWPDTVSSNRWIQGRCF